MRLTRLPGGGFRLDGAPEGPIEGVPGAESLVVRCGSREWNVLRGGNGANPDSSAIIDAGSGDGGTIVTWDGSDAGSAASVLLEDGRLFRVALAELDPPEIQVGRWDVPGAYLTASPGDGGWRIETTAAGRGITPRPEILIATCYEIGRRCGWL